MKYTYGQLRISAELQVQHASNVLGGAVQDDIKVRECKEQRYVRHIRQLHILQNLVLLHLGPTKKVGRVNFKQGYSPNDRL